ncbi:MULTISPECIES: DUF3237 domain-containing protein [Clostridium]|uniref:DUF3237 domain-containing protein n=1 Tax=Clostridium TaxID=1485 RepID=UPI0008252350|nr:MULTISPECIES: DUF3237 domain-containing protein [Clostridium]PJI07566.1 DUF3237 domain-containing protein [Clostridium sp. CT7]
MLLEAELVMELTVELAETKDVGETCEGYLRLIPIVGGTFSGDKIKGKILPGGYDWNVTTDKGSAHALAKYGIQTDDGVCISIENEGYINLKASEALIKTTPRFQAPHGKYAWLNSGVFVGSLEGGKTEIPSVNIKIYKMK